jgi:hypothetical protein
MPSVTQPPSTFLAGLRRALLADFEAELVLACKYAVLQAAGYRRSEIARMLEVGPAAIRDAELRVKRAAERLDHGD